LFFLCKTNRSKIPTLYKYYVQKVVLIADTNDPWKYDKNGDDETYQKSRYINDRVDLKRIWNEKNPNVFSKIENNENTDCCY